MEVVMFVGEEVGGYMVVMEDKVEDKVLLSQLVRWSHSFVVSFWGRLVL